MSEVGCPTPEELFVSGQVCIDTECMRLSLRHLARVGHRGRGTRSANASCHSLARSLADSRNLHNNTL